MKKNLINPKNVRLARLNQRTCTRKLSDIINMSEDEYAIATLNGNLRKSEIVVKIKNGYDECLSGKFPCIPEPLFFFAFPEYAGKNYEIINEAQAKEMLFENKGVDNNTKYTLLGGNTRFAVLKKEKIKIPVGLFVDITDRIIGKAEVHYGRLFERFQNNLKNSLREYLRLMIMFLIMYYNNDARTQSQKESRTFNYMFTKEYMSKEDLKRSNTNLIVAETNLYDGCATPFDKKEGLEAYTYCSLKESGASEDSAKKMAAVITDCFFSKKSKTLQSEDVISDGLKSIGINPYTLSIENDTDFKTAYENLDTCDKKQEIKGDISYVSAEVKKHIGKTNLNDIFKKIAEEGLEESEEVKEQPLSEFCEGVLKYCEKTNTKVEVLCKMLMAMKRNEEEL